MWVGSAHSGLHTLGRWSCVKSKLAKPGEQASKNHTFMVSASVTTQVPARGSVSGECDLRVLRWNKPFPLQVALRHGVYQNNRNLRRQCTLNIPAIKVQSVCKDYCISYCCSCQPVDWCTQASHFDHFHSLWIQWASACAINTEKNRQSASFTGADILVGAGRKEQSEASKYTQTIMFWVMMNSVE